MSSLEAFLVFKDVAHTGNITKTSRRLHMSQPSVSIQIQNLEKEYGAQLLERTNRGVALTECGKIFYHYIEEIIRLTTEAHEDIVGSSTSHYADIHLGATFTIGEYLLPHLAKEICRNRQSCGIDAKISNTEVLSQAVLEGQLHLALIEGPVPDEQNFSIETFWHDELVVVVPNNHPWYWRKNITFDELKKENLIIREQGSGTRQVMDLAFWRNGFDVTDLNVKLVMGSTQAIKETVKEGVGIAILSALTVQEECLRNQFGILRVHKCSLTRPLNILTNKKIHLAPCEQSLIKLLRDQNKLLELFPTPILPNL